MRVVLNELSSVTQFKINESTELEPGVLAVVEGTFARYNKPNKNNRTYVEEVWDKALADPRVQARLAGKRMYGELDHPEDYLDIKIGKTAFCVTKLEKHPETETIEGQFKVLDTEAGRLLNTLLRFGSVLGVSSRASGELDSRGYVDPDSYVFETFDVVSDPSNEEAFPTLVECTQQPKPLKDILLSEISGADKSKLSLIREMASRLEENSASEIINKVEEEEAKLSTNPELEERLVSIEGKLDRILELLDPVGGKESGDSDKTAVTEPDEQEPVTEAIRRVKPKITESTNKRETRVLVTRIQESISSSNDNERTVRLIRQGKNK